MNMPKLTLIPLLLLLSLFSTVLIAQTPPARPVQVAAVQKSLFAPTVDMVGTIYSRSNVKLSAGVNGRLDWVAEPGSFVQQGEEVARIDPLPLTLQQAQQQAEIKRANINQQYLQRELKRLQELRQSNSASQFQLDQTQSQYELAKADLEIAQVKLQQIEDQLTRTVVRAPFSGVITQRLREAGGDVSRAETLVQMLDTENLEGRIFVPVKYLPFIRQSTHLDITANKHRVEARVKAIIPAADPRSQSFELRVSLPVESNSFWTAGQLIHASLPVKEAQQSLTVLRDALILRREGTFVVVIDKENKAHRHQVIVGQGQDDRVSISSDAINAGDWVATRGAERLQEGQVVEITKPNV